MKIINEKGKLFGIINLVDLLIVLLVVLIACAVGFKLLKQNTNYIGTNKTITFTVNILRTTESVADAFKDPNSSKLISNSQYSNANIISDSVVSIPSKTVTTAADGSIMTKNHPILKDVSLKIKMTADDSSPIIRLGLQEISVGSKFTVKTHVADADGTIDSVSISKP
jgi:hypothetical protein